MKRALVWLAYGVSILAGVVTLLAVIGMSPKVAVGAFCVAYGAGWCAEKLEGPQRSRGAEP